MTIEQSAFPAFNEQNQTTIRTDENYTMNNQDKVVDVFGGQNVIIKLPPQPVHGQTHRVMAPVANVFVNGNGHGVQNGMQIVPQGTFVDFCFSSAIIFLIQGGWVASCCAEADLQLTPVARTDTASVANKTKVQ